MLKTVTKRMLNITVLAVSGLYLGLLLVIVSSYYAGDIFYGAVGSGFSSFVALNVLLLLSAIIFYYRSRQKLMLCAALVGLICFVAILLIIL